MAINFVDNIQGETKQETIKEVYETNFGTASQTYDGAIQKPVT